MYGGHGYRPFYATEAGRISKEHQSKLPPTYYTDSEVQAGFPKLAEDFGFGLTMVFLEEKTGLTEEQIMTWELAKTYYRLRIYSWQAFVQKKYNEIENRKNKPKPPKPGK